MLSQRGGSFFSRFLILFFLLISFRSSTSSDLIKFPNVLGIIPIHLPRSLLVSHIKSGLMTGKTHVVSDRDHFRPENTFFADI